MLFLHIILISAILGSLEELHLSFNQIEIPVEENKENNETYPKITTLHFDGNRVENRDHLHWLSNKFPSLTSLVLCDCPLWTVRWKAPTARYAQVSTVHNKCNNEVILVLQHHNFGKGSKNVWQFLRIIQQ